MRSRLNARYLDDCAIGDIVDVVVEDFFRVVDLGRQFGLELNLSKCEALFLQEELPLLGARLPPEGIPSTMDAKTATLRLLASRLGILPAHQGFFILRNCFAAPKVTYILQCAPVWSRPDKLREFDEV
ncbi:hypothetical protein BV898_18423 [Hypsibius exemplaris]|uniref:Reverse transcriptase domain-containing protein n=1 Tax=Hypsibius exemplaris TaxID=2072580 RepID=A0A9X6NGW9_HYPEX|nr:hypothetical protein BV898_18423 [Hypsibius exemplaris]